MALPSMKMPTEASPIPIEWAGQWLLLWDGDCGFCRYTVEALLRWDRHGVLQAVPYADCAAWLPPKVWAACAFQAHLRAPDGRYWGGGDAVVEGLALIGFRRAAGLLRLWPLRWGVGWGYRWVASNRGRLGTLTHRLSQQRTGWHNWL